MRVTYASLFAGIEAFSVAAGRIRDVEWEPVFFSEIEPFPCAVLAHRFPGIPNLGDIRNIRVDAEKGTITNGNASIALPRHGIDILAGGSPCQDVSVAGQRRGMQEGSGTRSSLAFEYARLVDELRPRVLLWENVPGVLSSNHGLDFLAFLRALVERGYGVAWRVLDAQFTTTVDFPRAIPQRRKRVWLVGCAGGDERAAAQILFERAGLLGDSPPQREMGKGFAAVAGCVPARNAGLLASFSGDDVMPTLGCSNGTPGFSGNEVFQQKGAYLVHVLDMTHADEVMRKGDTGVAPTLQKRMGTGGNQVPLLHLAAGGARSIVRRITPTETERLFGFPDGWTAIPWRGKPAEECPDSPRYRALGNSWATNCAEWTLRRIVAALRLGIA